MLPLALCALCLCGEAPAASVTWLGGTNSFDVPGNWSGPALPGSGDSLVFGAPGAGGLLLHNNLTNPSFSYAGITFTPDAGAYVIGNGSTTPNAGNALAVTGSIVNNSTVTQTINNPLGLPDILTFTTTAGGGNITLGGDILFGNGIVAAGTGTLTLNGNNSYTGGTTVSQGTLTLNSNTAAGGYAAGAIVLGDGSTGNGSVALNFASGITGNDISLRGTSARRVNAVTVADTGSSGTATLGFTGATPMLYFDAALDRAVTITSNSSERLQRSWMGQITGPGAGAGSDSIIVDLGAGNWMTISAKDTGTTSVANTFAGNLRVKSGNLEIGGLTYIADIPENENLTLPATASVTVDAGATLQFVWGSQTFDALNGGGTITRNIADHQDSKTLTIGASGGSGAFSGTIGPSFRITKIGSGTQIFSGDNTYSDLTTIQEGTLQLGDGGTSGSVAGDIVNNATLVINRSDTFDYNHSISGSGTLVIDGGGIFRPTGNLAHTGPTQINSGTLVLSAALNYGLSASTVVTVAAGGTLDLSNRPQKIAGLEGEGLVQSTGGSTGSLTLEVDAGRSYTFAGSLGGNAPAFAITKSGPGTQVLSGQSYHEGGIRVIEGVLQLGDGTSAASLRGKPGADGATGIPGLIADDGAPGDVAVTVDGGTLRVYSQATLFGGGGGDGGRGGVEEFPGMDSNPSTSLGGYGGGGGNGGAAVLVYSAGLIVNNGTITGGSGGAGGDSTGGRIAPGKGGDGAAGVLFSAGGSLINSGTISSGAGGAPGTDSFGDPASQAARPGIGVVFAGGPGTLANQSGGVINGGVGMDAFANSVTLESGSTINGDLDMGESASSALTLTGGGSQIWSEAVTGTTTFVGTLSKEGTGTWTLDQAFDGQHATRVNSGTLLVNAFLAGETTVENSATLGGAGRFSGDVIVRNGGTLSPGNSPGQMTIENNLILEDGSILLMEFGGTDAGLFDQLDVQGSFTAGGTLNLTLIDGFTPVAGATFTLFNGTTPGYESGSFHFTTNLGGGLYWDTSALASFGTLTVVPEPSTYALLGLGTLSAALASRRRRKKPGGPAPGGSVNNSCRGGQSTILDKLQSLRVKNY